MHTSFPCGVVVSTIPGMGILGLEYHLGGVHPIPWITAEKERGERGVVGSPLPTKRGESKWYWVYQGSYRVPSHQ